MRELADKARGKSREKQVEIPAICSSVYPGRVTHDDSKHAQVAGARGFERASRDAPQPPVERALPQRNELRRERVVELCTNGNCLK